jgi:hypothetical protein
MNTETKIKFAEYLVNRLKFKLWIESERRVYYNLNIQGEVELVIDGDCVYLYTYYNHNIDNIYYNISAIKYLAEKLGYNGS